MELFLNLQELFKIFSRKVQNILELFFNTFIYD